MKSKLIVIEGVDGSGKRTQCELLAKELQSLGCDVSSYCFPDYNHSVVGPWIRRMLAGEFGDSSRFQPQLIAPLFALDRAEKASAIMMDLAAGRIVICDRYVYSNVAHQASRLPLSAHDDFKLWVERLEFDVLALPKADLTILLDVEDDVSIERREIRAKDSKGQRPLDDYERDSAALKAARNIYLWLAKEESWDVISSSMHTSVQDVHHSVMLSAARLMVSVHDDEIELHF